MNLSQEELEERVAVIKRFRALLEQQRTKFREYLKVLESQESHIMEENAESLLAHNELANQIVDGISSLQKVIVPMQELYAKTGSATYNIQDAVPIERIQKELTSLQAKVLEQNEKNRILLKAHMAQVGKQITEFRNPYRSLNSVYAAKPSTGSVISING